MRPCSDDFLTAVAQSHRFAFAATAINTDDTETPLTSVISGQVTLDANASQRGRLEGLVIADDGSGDLIPDDDDHPLAPYGQEVRVERGLILPDGTEELISLGIFRIEDADVDDSGEAVTITVQGFDRSKRISDARLEVPTQIPAGENAATAILSLLQTAWPDVPYSFASTTETIAQVNYEEGADPWERAMEIAASVGMELFFDGDGIAILRPVPSGGPAVLSISEGVDGVLLDYRRRWSRVNTRNRWIVTGENSALATVPRGVATDDDTTSPTYYFGRFGKVPGFFASPILTTDTAAAAAAESMLTKDKGTTRNIDFGAVVNPALEPFDVIDLARGQFNETHVIDSLTIPLTADEAMSGATRAVSVI